MNLLSKRLGFALSTLAVAGLLSAPMAMADHHEGGDEAHKHESGDMADKHSTKNQIAFWMADAEDKIMQLAEVTPEDKYGWRPMEGVRSTNEVFMHVCAVNWGMPSFWGVAPPEGFQFEGYEKSMTKKADIMANLKASFAHAKKSLMEADDATLAKEVNLFGQMETNVQGAYMMMLSHAHEHLGQSIAYARSNKIAPPWTAKQQAEMEAAKKAAEAAAADKADKK